MLTQIPRASTVPLARESTNTVSRALRTFFTLRLTEDFAIYFLTIHFSPPKGLTNLQNG
eukprot:m.669660 g.669660  ORF g.669660 m.669660 type:complete len:59 (+) comp22764_c0_seq3:87-263(+)